MWVYLDVNEFTGCRDTKWRKAAKWLKEQFGVTNRASYSWRRNERHFIGMEVENLDLRIASRYWTCPRDFDEKDIEAWMNGPSANNHRRIYYNCNDILLGEIDYGEPIESTSAL